MLSAIGSHDYKSWGSILGAGLAAATITKVYGSFLGGPAVAGVVALGFAVFSAMNKESQKPSQPFKNVDVRDISIRPGITITDEEREDLIQTYKTGDAASVIFTIDRTGTFPGGIFDDVMNDDNGNDEVASDDVLNNEFLEVINDRQENQ